jgi:ATP-binding cassette subfamily B protein
VSADPPASPALAAAASASSDAIDGFLSRVALSPARAARARHLLLSSAAGNRQSAGPPSTGDETATFLANLRRAGVLRRLVLTVAAYAAQLALLIAVWWMMGSRAVGQGAGAATGWLAAWMVTLALMVGLRVSASYVAGRLAIDTGGLVRERLLRGILNLDTELIRQQGIGQLLGRVIEAEAVESLALSGGILGLAAVFEITTGVVVLALGGSAAVQMALLAAWIVFALWMAGRYWRALQAWAADRLALTHDLVERMVGHRTLVAQQPPERQHTDEDEALGRYARRGQNVDRAAAVLTAIVPRGWLLLGVASLVPLLTAATSAGHGTGVAGIATSLGGVLFIYAAFRKLVVALPALAGAAVAWREVAPLFAAGRPAAGPLSLTLSPPSGARESDPDPVNPLPLAGEGLGEGPQKSRALVSARSLAFRYPTAPTPVLSDCSFDIHGGDRIVLEGPSGGGKSTLASLLAGLRAPDDGALLLNGADQRSLGLARWRAHIGAVPQFHENHVFSASFLFNLLMARRWPPRPEDVRDAEALCRELDLTGLLARMPAGLEQQIGETGWQLSHGERSRLFIARALLQSLDARILDESFAALDPETMTKVLSCVLRNADTLVVIAHP